MIGAPVENFYPRSPCGERLRHVGNISAKLDISIHALLAESDRELLFEWLDNRKFLSTLSLRRATQKPDATIFILHISIHALLAESDEL